MISSDAIFGAVVAIETAWLGALTLLALNRGERAWAPVGLSLGAFLAAYFGMLIWNSAVLTTSITASHFVVGAASTKMPPAIDALYFSGWLISAAILGAVYCGLLPKFVGYINP